MYTYLPKIEIHNTGYFLNCPDKCTITAFWFYNCHLRLEQFLFLSIIDDNFWHFLQDWYHTIEKNYVSRLTSCVTTKLNKKLSESIVDTCTVHGIHVTNNCHGSLERIIDCGSVLIIGYTTAPIGGNVSTWQLWCSALGRHTQAFRVLTHSDNNGRAIDGNWVGLINTPAALKAYACCCIVGEINWK